MLALVGGLVSSSEQQVEQLAHAKVAEGATESMTTEALAQTETKAKAKSKGVKRPKQLAQVKAKGKMGVKKPKSLAQVKSKAKMGAKRKLAQTKSESQVEKWALWSTYL